MLILQNFGLRANHASNMPILHMNSISVDQCIWKVHNSRCLRPIPLFVSCLNWRVRRKPTVCLAWACASGISLEGKVSKLFLSLNMFNVGGFSWTARCAGKHEEDRDFDEFFALGVAVKVEYGITSISVHMASPSLLSIIKVASISKKGRQENAGDSRK